MTTPNQYSNGAFTISEQTIEEGDRQWLELSITVTSGPIRLPLPSLSSRRAVTLRAEQLCLASIGAELSAANTEQEDSDDR